MANISLAIYLLFLQLIGFKNLQISIYKIAIPSF